MESSLLSRLMQAPAGSSVLMSWLLIVFSLACYAKAFWLPTVTHVGQHKRLGSSEPTAWWYPQNQWQAYITSASCRQESATNPHATSSIDGHRHGSCATSAGTASTLGVSHSLMEETYVPGLSGAVLKQSPSDFIVVELPRCGSCDFTPADPTQPLAEEIKKPVVRKIPSPPILEAAITAWRNRCSDEPERPGANADESVVQDLWHLATGFDKVAGFLGGRATEELQDWMLSVSRRIVFKEAQAELEGGMLLDSTGRNLGVGDASSGGTMEAAGDRFTDDSCLPPPLPLREVRLVCPPDLDKPTRTLLHGVFREHLPYLSTRAIVPGANVIVASAGAAGPSDQAAVSYGGEASGGVTTGNVDVLGDIRVENVTYLEVRHEAFGKVRKSWPAGRGQYLEFTLYKAGRSTLEAVDLLCRRLRVHRSRLSFAGAKDRRALTAQKMRCWKLLAEDLHGAQASGALEQDGIAVSDFRYVSSGLKLGDLSGNFFEVLLRPPLGGWGRQQQEGGGGGGRDNQGLVAKEAFRHIRDEGFINYFGTQRFGRDGTNSVDVGLMLLRSDWTGAVRGILEPHPADSARVSEAKQAFFAAVDGSQEQRGEALRAAVRMLPRNAFPERDLMESLAATGGKDPLGPLLALPRSLLLLYVHAYQSLVWNEAASLRMGGGLDRRKPVEGDLVLVSEGVVLSAWDTRRRPERLSADGGAIAGAGTPSRGRGRGDREEQGRRRSRVRGRGSKKPKDPEEDEEDVEAVATAAFDVVTLTAEQARSGAFGIEHVVIPLPGQSVRYPSNEIGENVLKRLHRDGVADVVLRGHKQHALDLEGSYRHVLVHPRDLAVKPVPPALPGGESETFQPNQNQNPEKGETERTHRGVMSLSATSAYIRARFHDEVVRRFRGARPAAEGAVERTSSSGLEADESEDAEGRVNPRAGRFRRADPSFPSLRVSFSLPVSSYATTLLQHLTGEGLGRVHPREGSGVEDAYDGDDDYDLQGEFDA